MQFVQICCNGHGKRRVFSVEKFSSNLSLLCAEADKLNSDTAPSYIDISVCQLKEIALGGCYLTKCKCCNQRVLRRTHADCGQAKRFDRVLDNLTRPSSVPSECEPGNEALPSTWFGA